MSTEKNLYLTGYRGLEIVGRRLAEQLQTQCIDLNDVVEAVAGKSIREFLSKEVRVVPNFKSSALVEVSSQDGVVISLGVGQSCGRKTEREFPAADSVSQLDAQPETILKHCEEMLAANKDDPR